MTYLIYTQTSLIIIIFFSSDRKDWTNIYTEICILLLLVELDEAEVLERPVELEEVPEEERRRAGGDVRG